MKKSKTKCLVFLKRMREAQFLRIMRVTVFLLLLGISNVFAGATYSQSVTFTFSEKNMTIGQLFGEIQKQSEFIIFYKDSQVDLDRKVDVVADKASVEEILEQALTGAHLDFKVFDRQIVVFPAPTSHIAPVKNGEAETYQPQQKEITGKVTDSGDLPLPGVSVVVTGTTIGTVTNADGEFSLNIPVDAETLQFSFVGMKTQEVPVGERTTISLVMEQETIGLEEVVAVGYGVQRKVDLTGSVASVSGDRIKDIPVSNVEQALKGQVAGVQIFQNSGSPSAGTTIRIRGNGSITAGSSPLYVIDGIPVTGGSGGTGNLPESGNPMNSLNPNDIASIDILKDASATAIYGSRGANGVVIITTETGKAGRSTLQLDVSVGMQNVARKLDVLSPEEFVEYHIESRNNGWLRSGGDLSTPNEDRGRYRVPPIFLDQSLWNTTDWQDEIFRTGMIQNYNLSATGGNEDVRYSVSGGYFENQGIIIESSLKRYSFRLNVDAKINERINVGARFNPSYAISDQLPTEGHFRGSVVGMALRLTPLISPYEENGTYTNPLARRANNGMDAIGTLGAVDNPVAVAKEDQYTLDQGRLFGTAFLEYEIYKGLIFKTSLGVDYNSNRTHAFLSSKTGRRGSPPPNIPSGSAYSSQKLNWLNENHLTYSRTIKDAHRITAMAGYSAQKNDYRFVGVEGNQYPSDKVPYVNAAGVIEGGTETRNQWSLISFFGRVNYILKDRYMLTATLRRDGSSRFGEERKYGTFPSAAVAWRMSEENFMSNITLIDNLKWRFTYGVSGNNDIGNYTHIPNILNRGYVLGSGQSFVNATALGRLANPFVTWETTRSYDIGVDLGILDNRIELIADIYKKNTDGLLLSVNIPAVSGFTSTIENIGEVQNKGLELGLNTINLDGKLKWNTSFNIAFNRNKVLALGGSAGDFIRTTYQKTVVGEPLGLFFVRVTDGIFNNQSEIDAHVPQDNNPQPGDRRFKDVNGDLKVDNNDEDFVGNPHPDFTFGFNNTFSYGNFELSILTNGSYGNDAYYNYVVGANLNGNLNQDAVTLGRWRSEQNPGSGNVPKAVYGFSTLTDVDSDFYVMDASYWRIANITLAYNLPRSIAAKLRLKAARIYLSGQNVHTFTKYPGFDPEIAASGNDPTYFGVDRGLYPLNRIFSLGCNLTF